MARPSLISFLLVLGALDAAAVLALRPDAATAVSAATAAPVDAGPGEDGWALCQTRFEGADVTPGSVAVTYLDPGTDDGLVPSDVRAWFGEVPGHVVDVYRLELRSGRRRIAFELTRGKWAGWDQAAGGATGRTACGRLRAALHAAGVGRPAAGLDAELGALGPDAMSQERELVRSRYDFEFIYARRPALYRTIEWVGTLDHSLELEVFGELSRWLNRS